MQDFTGIPYANHGRGYGGADCWGLVYLFYRDALGLEIPTYEVEMSSRRIAPRHVGPLIAAQKDAHWLEVEPSEKQTGDVVLMRSGTDLSHVGIYMARDMLLHTEGGDYSVCVPLNSVTIRKRIAGFYRLKP